MTFWKSSSKLAAKNLVVTKSIASYDNYDEDIDYDEDEDDDDDDANSVKVTPKLHLKVSEKMFLSMTSASGYFLVVV